MDNNFSEKLKTVLADPESMAKITEIAKNFAASSANRENPENQSGAASPAQGQAVPSGINPIGNLMSSPAIAEVLRALSDGSGERIALLQAMRPFVRDEKKEKLDRIIQTMKMLSLISSAQNLL